MAHKYESSVDALKDSHQSRLDSGENPPNSQQKQSNFRLIRNLQPEEPQSTLTVEQVAELTEAFTLNDMEGNGTIPTSRVGQLLRSLGKNPTPEEVDHMIKNTDVNGDGVINCEQFLKMMSRRLTESNFEVVMRDAFNICDIDRDGVIGTSELQCVLGKLGEHLSDDQAQRVLEEADVDGDGQFTYQDFMSVAIDLMIKHDKVPSPI